MTPNVASKDVFPTKHFCIVSDAYLEVARCTEFRGDLRGLMETFNEMPWGLVSLILHCLCCHWKSVFPATHACIVVKPTSVLTNLSKNSHKGLSANFTLFY